MKKQRFGNPQVSLSWVIERDSYASEKRLVTLDTPKGREQLVNTITALLDQGLEVRIGSDGYCLLLEANLGSDEFSDASYQYVDDDHEVVPIELTTESSYFINHIVDYIKSSDLLEPKVAENLSDNILEHFLGNTN